MATAPGAAAPARFNATASYNGAPLAGSNNPLDAAALSVLQANDIEPVGLSSDTEFLRRVTGDLLGRLPTDAERVAFITSTSTDKRSALIDSLLASDDFANHWTSDVISPWLGTSAIFFDDVTGNPFPFDPNLFPYVQGNVAISQLIQDLTNANTPVGAAFLEQYASLYSGTAAVDNLMLAFTGMTSKCARCHDHPLTTSLDDPRWVQDDNYALYAFFAQDPTEATKITIAGVFTGSPVQPSFVVDGYANAPSGLPQLTDPLPVRQAVFGQLLSSSKAFTRGTAHRIWTEIATQLLNPSQFLAANLASVQSPALLAALQQVFTDQGTRLSDTLRVFMNSNLYQLTSSGPNTAADPYQGRYVLRREHAEVIEGADYAVAGVTTGTTWTVTTLQATATPLNLPVDDIFALNFGYPLRYTAANNVARSDSPSMQQELIQLNDPVGTSGIVTQPGSNLVAMAAAVDAQQMTFSDAVNTLFHVALSRDATPAEVNIIQMATVGSASTLDALQDAAVGIAGSAEYLFRH